jgi:hypothetical protein
MNEVFERGYLTIRRANKIDRMYDIDFSSAQECIDWNPKHHVSYCETKLIVYIYDGIEMTNEFVEWADWIEEKRKARKL